MTGAVHRARIDLPHGFEYAVAEVGSASSTITGPIAFDLKNSYVQGTGIDSKSRPLCLSAMRARHENRL